ncbi:MAG TPA: hypothetical protein GX396_02360 [Tissierellia bacterium]|nr:hypothetical protein [Tissierellia bacterium]
MKDNINKILNEIRMNKEIGERDYIRVEEVLSMPSLEGCQILGGKEGLKNICRHMTILETPDGISWLKGGEFLVTAGYALVGQEEAKENLIKDLYKKGVSAIAIKDRRYFGEISEKLVADSDKYKIPLIKIPYSVIYSEMISDFYYLLFYKKNENILNLNNLYQKLLKLSFIDKNNDEILFSISDLSNANVFLFDNLMNLVCQKVINTRSYEDVSSFAPFDSKGAILDFNIKELIVNKKVNNSYISVFPINKNNKEVAYMLVVTDEKIDTLIQNIIEYGVSIISSRIENEIFRINQPKFKKTLLEIMLNNKELPYEFYVNVEKDIGWDKEGDIAGLCIKVEFIDDNDMEDFNNAIHNIISEIIGSENYMATDKNNYNFIVLKLDNNDNLEEVVDYIYKKLNEYRTRFIVSIGVSNKYECIKNVDKLYDESYLAVLFSNYDIVYFNSLDTIKLLYPLKDDEEIIKYYNKTIKKLEVYDAMHDSNLVETLETYFRYNMNNKVTASKLFIHVETLRYRLNRIEEITGFSTNETEGLFALQMGIKLMRLLRLK